MATKKASNIVIKNLDIVKDQAINLHDNAMHATDTMVDNSLAIGKEWQGLFAKAMSKGVVLFGKQQEMVLDTLETMKEQYLDGGIQLRKLLALKSPIRPLKTPLLAKIEAKRKTVATKKVKTTRSKKSSVAKATVNTKKAVKKVSRKAAPKTDVIVNDLKIIEGIGPKIEGLFHKAGIRTFEQMAKADLKTLKAVLEQAGPRFKMHNPSTWRKQAQMAAKGKFDALKKLQKELKGGKKVKK